ncbi:MAG: general secretion pathway protein GspK [Proteobacteria bacterium]|nr:general secretion pathway protein GspK [Pseudomonadota bacterium]
MRAERPRERGAALIVVLWGVALIAAAIIAIGATSRSESLIGRNALENARARHAAEAGIQLALHRLLAYPRGTHLFDGTPMSWQDGTATVVLAIQDEEGKIDLNAASFELIAGVLRGAGLGPDAALPTACRIVARRGYYDPQCLDGDRAPPAVEPGLLVAVEEARRLLGVSDVLYRRLAPLVTVFSGSSAIDPRVAPRDVLLAVPTLSTGLVDSWIGRRTLAEGLGELRDRRYFAVTTGRTFAVSAHATTAGGGRHRAEMVVRLTHRPEQPFAVLAWREPAG